MDKLIRELLINVKQQGAAATTKSLKGIVDALQDAAVGAELANEQLKQISPTLASIASDAKKASSALGSLGAMKNLDKMAKSLDTIEEYLDELLTTSTTMSEKMVKGFSEVTSAVDRMGNAIAGSTERAEDQLIDLNNAVNRTSGSLSDTEANARRATRGLGDTSGAARGATRDFSALAQIGGTIPIIYAAIASNAFVLQSAFEQIKIGDQLNRLEEFGSIIGSMTGTPVQALAASLQRAVNGAISFQEAMQQASMASTYGFNTKQIEQFGLVARRAAAVLGVDMVDALNRVIKGVSKQEVELLDELGVTIRLNDAYAKYVQQLNSANTGITYNVNSLNTYQKQQAYANAVIEDSNKKLGQLDSALRSTPWEEFAANATAALRTVQQEAAKQLGPIAELLNSIFYTPKIETAQKESEAAFISIQKMDPSNYMATLNAYTNALERSKNMYAETEPNMAKYRRNLQILNGLEQEWNKIVSNQTMPAAAKEKELDRISRVVNAVKAETTKLNKDLEANSENVFTFKPEQEAALEKIKQAPDLYKKISDAAGNIDMSKLQAATDAVNASNAAIKNDVPAVTALINDQSSSIKNANKISADLGGIISTIRNNAAATGQSEDKVLATYNMQYKTMSDLVKAQSVFTDISKKGQETSEDMLAVQKEIAKVGAETGDREKAQQAGRAVEIAQLDRRLAVLREAQKSGVAGEEILDEINKLETQRLSVQNQSLQAAEKVKDVSDKIVGIEEQIALLKDNSLTSEQFNLKNLELQVKIEQERQKILEGNAQKQRDYMQSKLQEAQLEKQIRDLAMSRLETVSKRNRDFSTDLRSASSEYTPSEEIMNRIVDLERERADLIKDSKEANVALDTNRILDLNNRIKVAEAELEREKTRKSRSSQDAATNLLGGSYSSTSGMSPDQTAAQNFINNQQGYAEAISNLQALNSEATAVGQSLGNLTNAMMHFSQGSIDTTTMAAATMQTIASAIQFSTSQQINSIDAAIAAEKARDGQSEESKAKIKKMEAEKIKIQQESAKKQILIQTAVAVMQAANAVPYPWSIPLMIAAAASGALAYAQASNASSSTLEGLGSGSTTSSLSLGKRDNSVDVSASANAGELSYIRGDSGIGNANNFAPRAEGGNMIPGVGYITGENGIEVVTPTVPSKVTPASEIASQGSSQRPLHVTIQAMDARSFNDYLLNNSNFVKNAVEAALNEDGTSLSRLG